MPSVHIGTRTLQGRLETYARRFDLLEVRPDPKDPVRSSTLRKWRDSVPSSFAFSVVLPPDVTMLKSGEQAEKALAHSLETARILQARVIVIATPSSVTPTVANRKRLQALAEKLPHDVVRRAWEPSGLWEPEESQRLAADLDLVLVRDAARESIPPSSVAYTRIRGLGEARRMSASRIDRVAKELRSKREAFIVVETEQPVHVAKALRDALASDHVSGARTPRTRTIAQPLRTEDEEQE